MVNLISEGDNEVLNKSGFIKNAVMYKDLFAFYDAYVNLLSQDINDIPNYCKLNRGGLCLEGVCLFMKTYASELGFESVRLTLGYLKILYYTIASFSDGKIFPDKKLIEQEFKQYRAASTKLSANAEEKVRVASEKHNASKKDFDELNKKYAKLAVSARILEGLFIVFLILGFMSSMVAFAFYFAGKISLTSAIIAGVCLLVCLVGIAVLFKFLSKRLDTSAGETAYVLQNKKRVKDEDLEVLKKSEDILFRIASEKYEFKNNFSKVLSEYSKPMQFKKVAALAKEYRLLSYNIKLDVITLFENQENEIKSILGQISHIDKNNGNAELSEIYQNIDGKDWLMYNNEVKLEFLKKFIEVAEHSYDWKLEVRGEKINPFGIDAKKLAKETVAYLKSKDDLFITTSLDALMGTNLVKNEKILFLDGSATPENLRELKAQFISHFYNYDSIKKYDNLFVDKKLSGSAKVSEELIEQNAKIPTLVWLKIKLAENRLKMNNADSNAILSLASVIDSFESGKPYELESSIVVHAAADSASPFFDVFAEDLDDYGVKYNYGEATFIGYRLS